MASSIEKQKKHIKIICNVLPLLVNLVVIAVLIPIHFPIPNSKAYEIWSAFMDKHPELNFTYIPSFMLPILVSYLMQKHDAKKNNLTKDEAEKKELLSVPIRSATVSVIGWGIALALQSLCSLYVTLKTGVNVFECLKISALFTILAWVLVFSCTYILMETLNRSKFIPIYFPDGKISQTKKNAKPSITFTFLMYYTGLGIFPCTALLLSFITERANQGLKIDAGIIFVILLFLILGIFITVLLSNLFKKPLNELKSAAEKISDGDFNVKVKVVSADEIGTLGETFNSMSKSLEEKEFMKDVFGKIVAPDVRDHLLNDGIALGGEKMDVTILFCDIRGFTTLSEKMDCEKIVQMLNQYFTAMSECIMMHNGIINKYIGDAIMAIFGAPVKSKTHALDSYLAALKMKEALKKVNQNFKSKNFPELKFGIGIHTGTVIAGNIGSNSRMEYTVIGDSVNVASRIEGLCKEFKTDLLISESTAKQIQQELLNEKNQQIPIPEFLAESAIRGKEEKIMLYSK